MSTPSMIGILLVAALAVAGAIIFWFAAAPPLCPLCRHSVRAHSVRGCSGSRRCSCVHHGETAEAIDAWWNAMNKMWSR